MSVRCPVSTFNRCTFTYVICIIIYCCVRVKRYFFSLENNNMKHVVEIMYTYLI